MDTTDSETGPNLVGFRINHRTMRADTRRLADLSDRVAAGLITYEPPRCAPSDRRVSTIVVVRPHGTSPCSGRT